MTRKNDLSPQETINKIAEIATDIGFQAGVGSLEIAGQLISSLAASPGKTEKFLAGKSSVIDDDGLLDPAQGCLSWHKQDGKVITPSQYRAAKKQPDA